MVISFVGFDSSFLSHPLAPSRRLQALRRRPRLWLALAATVGCLVVADHQLSDGLKLARVFSGGVTESADAQPEGLISEAPRVNPASFTPAELREFTNAYPQRMALDAAGTLAYLCTSPYDVRLAQERFPKIHFHPLREHAVLSLGSAG